MSSAMARFLEANKSKWTETAAKVGEGNDSNYEELPDGLYIAMLSSATLGESKASSKLQITWVYVIMLGDYEGETKREYMGMETEKALRNLARRMKFLGYDPREYDITEDGVLEDWLAEVSEQEFLAKIRLKTNGDFQNVYCEQLLDGTGNETVAEHNARVAQQAKAAAPPAKPEKPAKPEPPKKPEPPVSNGAAPKAAGKTAPAPPPKPAPAPEPAAEEEDEEEGEDLEVGMTVAFEKDGKELQGKVISIDDATESAVVKVGLKRHTVSFDDMELIGDTVEA